jgi:hypothetical protein
MSSNISENMSDEAAFCLMWAVNAVALYVFGVIGGAEVSVPIAMVGSLILLFFLAPTGIISFEWVVLDGIVGFIRKRRQNAKANETLDQ